MTTGHEKLDVIRKLLAKAEGTDSPAEAQTYAEKAAELMTRYAIDEALVRAPVADDPLDRVTWTVEAPYQRAKQQLASAICRHNSLFTIWQGKTHVVVVGRRSDIERAEFLYTHLLLQATGPLTSLMPPVRRGAGDVRAYRRAWLLGFATAISQRMAKTRVEVVRDSEPGTALVLTDRAGAAEAHARSLYPNLTTVRQSPVNIRGYEAGKAAGGQADIGNSRVGGRRTAIR